MKHIIVGIDAGDGSKLATRQAAHLADATGARLHLVTVIGRSETQVVKAGSESWYVNTLDEAKAMVRAFIATLGVSIDHETHAVTGDAAEGLLAMAIDVEADLIVVGNHRMQGLPRILGSVGSDVLAKAPCDVYIAKTR